MRNPLCDTFEGRVLHVLGIRLRRLLKRDSDHLLVEVRFQAVVDGTTVVLRRTACVCGWAAKEVSSPTGLGPAAHRHLEANSAT
jgi:hypothetical protein